ncbi:hypothetical protein ABFS83_08G088400 [Erythranthe nasuta]
MQKMKKGWLAVQVGLEEDEDGGFQKFSIPISYLYNPLFQRILDKAREIYGYNATGPLRLPCSVEDFLHLRWRIERETAAHGGGAGRQFQAASSLSFRSC